MPYNGRTLNNIQEVLGKIAKMEVHQKDYEIFNEFRKNYVEPDLLKLLEDTELVTGPVGELSNSDIEYLEKLENEDVICMVEVKSQTEDRPLKRKSSITNSKVSIKATDDNVHVKDFSSFRQAGSKSSNDKENQPEDEFLQQYGGKFIEMVNSLIVNSTTGLTFKDIAGLHFAKQALNETVILPMIRPDIFTGIRSPAKGILLFGPPGTGKTFLARVAASECDSTFFSVSASSMTSKWIGESEKLVRALFAVAKAKQPTIIFIDEIDSLLSARTSDDKDNARGLKTEFLVQLDGMNSDSEDRILVIAATNRPDCLDEAARRRFTKRIYVGLPNPEAREKMIRDLLRNEITSLTDDDYKDIVEKSVKFSCSDVKELCRSAAGICVRQLGDSIKQSNSILPPISKNSFEEAFKEVGTSVCEKDIKFHLEWNLKFGSFKEID
eukprot:NODE_40_length_35084_cov_0.543519.p8 type:complete len:439 gc:universal NODE_40_length_35084_cov_0.543519:4171-2855(-)